MSQILCDTENDEYLKNWLRNTQTSKKTGEVKQILEL
jgi:hypothetical protein